ncbi:hypothetical protein V9L05_17440 [Bernardetia sp. Wsw4-3y2]|uniref:hypothetical protein n=1 Tax=Bernardetia sp. Wsw4-3y2 TaxID=3127471 RepID=UPI0030CD054D
MKNNTKITFSFFIKIILFALSLCLITGITWIDAHDSSLNEKFGESSWTEYAQELILILTVIFGSIAAYKLPRFQILLSSLAYLCLIYFIREWNNYLGNWWKIGVLMVSLFYLPYLFIHKKEFWKQLVSIWETFPMGIFITGNLILHVFSRIYGKTEIWTATLGENYHRSVKNASEESIELLAYTILFVGVLFLIEKIYQKHSLDISQVHI